jgi:hypothetical protein
MLNILVVRLCHLLSMLLVLDGLEECEINTRPERYRMRPHIQVKTTHINQNDPMPVLKIHLHIIR